MSAKGPLSELEQIIALNLLERTGSYLNYFISVCEITRKGQLNEDQIICADFLKEVSDFLKKTKE